jgi:hypothetical protein
MPALFAYAPPLVWSACCAVLATIYYFAWPRKKAVGLTRGLRLFILRWFHSLVWVLLGVALGSYELGPGNVRTAAKLLSVLALLVYIVFVIAAYAPRRGTPSHLPSE